MSWDVSVDAILIVCLVIDHILFNVSIDLLAIVTSLCIFYKVNQFW